MEQKAITKSKKKINYPKRPANRAQGNVTGNKIYFFTNSHQSDVATEMYKIYYFVSEKSLGRLAKSMKDFKRFIFMAMGHASTLLRSYIFSLNVHTIHFFIS